MSSAPSHPAMLRRPSVFLSLAPTTSDSYPQVQRSQQQQQQPAKTAPQPLTDNPAAITGMEMHKRRSSSLSSTSSKNTRFLKLGPVHWGEHMEEHQSDFAIE